MTRTDSWSSEGVGMVPTPAGGRDLRHEWVHPVRFDIRIGADTARRCAPGHREGDSTRTPAPRVAQPNSQPAQDDSQSKGGGDFTPMHRN